MLGSNLLLPLHLSGGGELVCESVGKADLLSDHFDSKQSKESVDRALTCHPSRGLITFAAMSSEVRSLLLDLDSYGGTDPLGMFPLLLMRTADVRAPFSEQCFSGFIVSVVSLHAGERQINVCPIPKSQPSSSSANY